MAISANAFSAFEELGQTLELERLEPNVQIGLYRQLPLAVSLKTSQVLQVNHDTPGTSPPTLTIQIGYPFCDALRRPMSERSWGTRIDALVGQGKARIATDEHRTIMWIFDAENVLSNGQFGDVLQELVSGLSIPDNSARGNRCHECLRNPVDWPTYCNAQVSLICAQCLATRAAAQRELTALTSAGFAGVCCMAIPAIAVGAVAWSGIWILWEWLVGLLVEPGKTAIIPVPRIVEVIVAMLSGAGVAAPIGWLVSRVRGRGNRFAGVFGIGCCLMAIFLGEIAFWTWAVSHESSQVRWTDVIPMLPRLWLSGGIHTFLRAGIAVLAGYFSYHLSKPRV
jgi:hypothetical protein